MTIIMPEIRAGSERIKRIIISKNSPTVENDRPFVNTVGCKFGEVF